MIQSGAAIQFFAKSFFKKIFILLICILCGINSVAQNASLSGKITDNNQQPLPGASVAILTSDSSLVKGSTTDTSGNFLISGISPGKFIVKVTYLGFRDYFVEKIFTDQPIEIGRLILRESSTTLNAVQIEGQVAPVQQKGDTTQFNADAYKTSKDATAEDLVTKMPGVTVQDGKVQAQGEDVKKVLIDGKPFLGDDPNAALKNLPAEVIDKIQVFDKKSDQSEFTGFDDGNTSKTINIVTRPQFRNGTFGRAYAGYGNEDTYKGGLSVNFFKDKRKLTLLGNANNINEQNFATDDLLGVVGTSAGRQGQRGSFGSRQGGGGGRWQPQNDAGNFLVDQKNGISKTNSGGINYANQWKKTDFSISYFFNRSENNAFSNLFRQYFTGSDGLIYRENNNGTNTNTNHRANMKFEFKFDTMNSVLLQPRFSMQNNKGRNTLSGINSDSNGALSNAVSTYASDLDGISFSAPLLYRHSFAKRGRTFSANLTGGYNSNEGNSNLNSLTVYSVDSIPTDTMNQSSDINTHGSTYSSELVYTEPIGKKSQLSINYRGNYNISSSDKITYAYSPVEELYNTLDTALSNKFTSKYLTNSGGLNYRYNDSLWNIMGGVSYQVAGLKNERVFPVETKLDRQFSSLLPVAMVQYKFTQRKNLRLFYRSSNNSPSVTQLQDVINNNNPLQLTAGNPDLKQDWQNNVNVRYSAVRPDKNRSFFVFISATYTQNYIGSATYVANSDSAVANGITLASGSQITRPVNLDSYYSLRSFSNYSFPFPLFKSSLNINGNLGYTHTPSSFNGQTNYSSTATSGVGFALSSNISQKFDFLLSSNANYSDIKNSIRSESNSNYFSLSSKFKIQAMPYKGLVLQTDITHQKNSGLSSSYNRDYFLWNAGIGYKFLKNQVAELRLTVFDILKQNKSIVRNTSDTYYEDVESNVLQQYFMLTFTYNLKFFKVDAEK